jgi:hypothetical protein
MPRGIKTPNSSDRQTQKSPAVHVKATDFHCTTRLLYSVMSLVLILTGPSIGHPHRCKGSNHHPL